MAAPRGPSRLGRRHLPYIVRRRGWAKAITALLMPLVGTIAGFMLFAASTAPEMMLAGRTLLLLLGGIMLLATLIGADRSFTYHVEIEADGVWINGLIFKRFIAWDEISSIDAHPNFRLPGYYAAIRVDGSRNPKRHWSSLWFGFYDIPPLMQFGGKELTRLLRHAKRRADKGWPDAPPRTTRKIS